MPTHRVVKIDELSQYFHLPEKAVAKQLGVCLTSLKKICRQNGIARWPYRKLKSLDKKITKIESAMTNPSGATEDPSTMLLKWEMLKLEKKNLPFSGGDDSDSDTKKRCAPVANTVTVRSPPPPRAVSPLERLETPATAAVTPPAATPSSLCSDLSSPTSGGGSGLQRAVHSLLEQKLRQVGSVSEHRQNLAEKLLVTVGQPESGRGSGRPTELQIPEDMGLCSVVVVDNTEPELDISAEDRARLNDFYCRAESGRIFDSARFDGPRILDSAHTASLSATLSATRAEDGFHMPLPITSADNVSFTDLFHGEETGNHLSESLFNDEFMLLSATI